jgi:hypothetical protein
MEHGLTAEHANDGMLLVSRYKHSFTFLPPPQSMGSITAADVNKVSSAEAHREIVKEWAKSAWMAWSTHHETIRKWSIRALAAKIRRENV